MQINYFKDYSIWSNLAKHNNHLLDVGKQYTYSLKYDLKKKEASYWMNPFAIKNVPVGRSYPKPHPASESDEYNILVYLGYYLPLFLINLLYSDKTILIEDTGAGDGKFYYYLDKLGFNNFHLIENFTQCPEHLLKANLEGINYKLNEQDTLCPTVVTNNGCFNISTNLAIRWTPSIELAVCYTHEGFDCPEFFAKAESWGYKFLCRDRDNLAIAFVRADKYDEFSTKLKEYEV